ncbi:MAG: hypothetical protein V4621_03760 [Pseudomonadota bacterium]
MTLSYDVSDAAVRMVFAPFDVAEDLPVNRVALTGVSQQHILRMRGVVNGGAATGGGAHTMHPAFVVLQGQPQDRAEDGVDIMPHETLKLKLALAFASDIVAMAEIVQALTAALAPGAVLPPAQKEAVIGVVQQLIALKIMTNDGAITAVQITPVAQALMEKLAVTLQAPGTPPVLAQFVQAFVGQVAMRYDVPVLTQAVARLTPLVATLAPMPTTPPVWMAVLAQNTGVPLAVLSPTIGYAVPASATHMPTADQSFVSASPLVAPAMTTTASVVPVQATQTATQAAPAVIGGPAAASIPSVAVTTSVDNLSVSTPPVTPDLARADTTTRVPAPASQSLDVKPDTAQKPAAPLPQVNKPVVAAVNPVEPPAVAQRPPAAPVSVAPLAAAPAAAPAAALRAVAPVITPVSILAASTMPAMMPAIMIAMPSAAPIIMAESGHTKGPCGKANCFCAKEFQAVAVQPYMFQAQLRTELGEKAANDILAKHGGDVQKTTAFIAAEQKMQTAVLSAIDAQMKVAEVSIKASQTAAMDALRRSLSESTSSTRSDFAASCANGTCGHDHHNKDNEELSAGQKPKRVKFDRNAYKAKPSL